MPRGPVWWRVPDRERGFALLICLWSLVLIAFIVAHVTTAGRSEVRIADNLATNAAAQAAADGAIFQAIFNQAEPRPDQRWPLDGAAHELQIGVSRITVRITGEDGLINPNLASIALLEGLYRAVGSDPQTAADLALATAEWIGSAKQHTPDQLRAQYRAAGLDYGPTGSPLEAIDELGRVRGVMPKLLDALRPHLSLFGPAEPKASAADPVVTAAIALAGRAVASAGPALAGSAAPAAAPDALKDVVTVRIIAIAHGPGNARAGRTATARVGAVNDRGYALLTWESGAD